ncbi:MAG TPA: hypothetical protein VIM36_09185 [Gemmatimonadaceae bacterium]|jgi:hypothetical protein
MKHYRFLLAALAAIISLAACADNPIAPVTNSPNKTSNSVAFSRNSANRSYTFTEIDVPNAYQTVPSGINANGVVVGWYFQGTGCPGAITTTCRVRGFTLANGVYEAVVYRDADGAEAWFTQLRGIGPSGDIVGTYRMTNTESTVNLHGFTLTTLGEFVPLDYPGHTNTGAQRILADGAILGCYHDTDQMLTMYGMTTDKRPHNQLPITVDGFSALDMNTTMINGGTPSGRKLTGFLTDMVAGKARGFVFEGGELTPFDAPSSSSTQAWDMGPSGIVVGFFQDADQPQATHGFVRDGDQYATINYPGSTYTDIFGTNASGALVGKFRRAATGSVFHGYLAIPQTKD